MRRVPAARGGPAPAAAKMGGRNIRSFPCTAEKRVKAIRSAKSVRKKPQNTALRSAAAI